jgi:glycosyltransferase involved in cell wall biosynthesis
MTRAARQSVSVVIPCYNHAAFLGEALESVAGQTWPADEIVVVDDGSTDETAEVAARFGSPVRYVRQAHVGIGGARNTGLRQSRAPFIAFLDADDLWPADSLALRMEAFETGAGVDGTLGTTEEFISPELPSDVLTNRIARGRGLARLAGAMVVRRAAFDRVGGFNEALSVGEWIDWIDRSCAAGLETTSLPGLALRRRIHAGNAGTGLAASSDYLAVLRAAVKRKALSG